MNSEWWSVFRTARRALFAVIAVLSVLWAILLSVYIAQEWKHAVEAQRVIVLLMICMNTAFSVLLYLMIVVVFQFWLEFARTVFLFSAHLGIAVSLTILGHTFDCSVFTNRLPNLTPESQGACNSTYRFALSMEYMLAIVFLMHTVALAVMSRVPRPSQIDRVLSVKEKITFDLEGQFQEIDLKSAVSAAISPGLEVTKVEYASVAPAMLMTLGSTPSRGPSQYYRKGSPSHSRSSTLEALPALPYGASSIAAFIPADAGGASPADPTTPRAAPTTRRMRSLRLNRYAVDPLARNGSVGSIATSDSSHSAYSQISSATIGGFPRPPQAIILHRSSSDASVLLQGPRTAVPHDLPPQLRPGTPTTARAFPRAPTMYSVTTAEQEDRKRLTVRRSLGLTRQPTQKLQLPNPFSPENSATVMRSPTL
ncbi:hypothetical protein FOMPIDRAFT_1013096 [Fomitopsis schrenkii]|uniref:Uncharacterized protein n=1 Tax=Fomitopsis schrenkii TaxID=2126942 RepID=S8EM31_FOMSC|nr:hypothetical protein FOMPIDRAFT_1013096 [Fomitopsis schrenkii]